MPKRQQKFESFIDLQPDSIPLALPHSLSLSLTDRPNPARASAAIDERTNIIFHSNLSVQIPFAELVDSFNEKDMLSTDEWWRHQFNLAGNGAAARDYGNRVRVPFEKFTKISVFIKVIELDGQQR